MSFDFIAAGAYYSLDFPHEGTPGLNVAADSQALRLTIRDHA
jgi:hypothetical protein